MNNITYSITENDNIDINSSTSSTSCKSDNNNWEEISLTNKKSKIDKNFTQNFLDQGERYAIEINYDLNYNFKYLLNILEFYGIKKSKLTKKEIIEKILEFEYDNGIENFSIVQERKRLFDNFIELKNDKFFSKFILGGFN